MGRRKKIPDNIELQVQTDVRPITPVKAKVVTDGWANALAGLGTAKDKRRYMKYSASSLMIKEELSMLYSGDGLISQIIDKKADDLTREWISIENDNDLRLSDEMERLDVQGAFNLAKKWSRLFGGALIFMGVLDGQSSDQPVRTKSIKSIDYLRVFDLGDIDTAGSKFVTDLKRPDYGDIELYKVRISVGTHYEYTYLHKSRCIPIYGVKLPKSIKATNVLFENRYWGYSIVPRVWSAVQDFVGAFGSVSSILYELIIGKYKFSDLDEMLAQGNEDKLKIRVETIDMTKSTINAVILGTDEEYTRDTASLAGIADILDRFMMHVSAVTAYPVTRLFGRSPAGLNATGENDIKNYYDDVRAEQKTMNRAVQQILDTIAAYLKAPVPVRFKWNPLFQLTEEQTANMNRIKAETYRTQADADQRYMDTGVVTAEQIYAMRFADVLGENDFIEQDLEPDGPDEPEEEDEQSVEEEETEE